jgi:DNA-binding transcriptional regulator YhcF (GntR family)
MRKRDKPMRQQMRAFDTYTHINELKKAGFNEEQAAVIIKSLVDSRETDISHLATKEQVNKLEASTKEHISEVKTQLIERMGKLEVSVHKEIADLHKAISDTHTSTLKWMVGTIVAFAGIILAGIKLF